MLALRLALTVVILGSIVAHYMNAARGEDGDETMDNIVCREVDGDAGFYTCPMIGTIPRLYCPADDAAPCYYVAAYNCRPPRTTVCRPAWVWEQAK